MFITSNTDDYANHAIFIECPNCVCALYFETECLTNNAMFYTKYFNHDADKMKN